MDYKDIEPYMQTRQLLGWTENLWKNQSGELWFVAIKGCYDYSYRLCLVNSEFRKDDIKGQCPSLHKTELETIQDGKIKCTALAWYIYAHAIPDCDIDDKKLIDIIKYYWGFYYWESLYDDLMYIQNNQYDIDMLLDRFELPLPVFLEFLYRVVEELNNLPVLEELYRRSSTNHSHDGNSNVSHKSHYIHSTWILFSPTSEGEQDYTMNGYPYTHFLSNLSSTVDLPPQLPSVEWILFYSPVSEDKKDMIAKSKVAALYFPSVLLAYVAEESRRRLLGTKIEWSNSYIDFSSRDFTWAIHNHIDVSQLDFHIKGVTLYNTYLEANFENTKELFSRAPGFELLSDDDIWNIVYRNEMRDWKEKQPMKDILPEDIYTKYAEYVEAFFKYFRAIHPCVCEQDETGANSSNPQTTQPVGKTEDKEQGDKDSKSCGPYYQEGLSQELKDNINDRLKKACKKAKAGPAVAKILCDPTVQSVYLNIEDVPQTYLLNWLRDAFGLKIGISAFNAAMNNRKNRNSSE